MRPKSDTADTREEALTLGLARYKSDKPCQHGHSSDRYTLTRNCVECVMRRAKAAHARDRERFEDAKRARLAAQQGA
jgi:hypothetical protein